MKFTNQFSSVSLGMPRWEKTPDGFLRCKARVLAERVMPYSVSELSDIPDGFSDEIVNMYVPGAAISSTESIRSLEGCPVVLGDHTWLSPEIVNDFSIGSVAGTPVMEGPYLVCDLLITKAEAIADIMDGRYPEISAAYLADTIFEPGSFDDNNYDAQQVNLSYNHIAIIPAGHGRAGSDVRILNKKKGEKQMAETDKLVRVRLKNTGLYLNTDDEGAAAVAAEEESSAGDLQKTMQDLESKNGELSALQAEVEELKGQLSVYKEKLDELLSTEAIEHQAAEMIEEQGEGEEIIENMIPDDDEKKEEVKNSIKGLYGSKLHTHVLSSIGVKVENMSSDAMRGAFKAQAQIANTMKGKKVVTGTKMVNSLRGKVETVVNAAPTSRTSRERLGFKPAA